ncbi:hypothetical protein J6590_107498, partial [Homalodisca vitripennis]
TSPALSRNMGSYGREKFPHLLEKSPHVREKFPPHTLILSKCSKFCRKSVFFGKIGDLLGPHTPREGETRDGGNSNMAAGAGKIGGNRGT